MGRSNSTSGRWLRLAVVAGVGALALTPTQLAMGAGRGGTSSTFSFPAGATNTVVSTPTKGGGYAENPPVEGGCGGPNPNNPVAQEFPNNFNANHSESELAVEPGMEQIVGSSKFFFDKFSTGYNFYLGSYNISGANPSAATNNIIQGYDCTTVGTQAMPPSWTNTTDPNVAFDSQGRVYQTMLPFNAFWTNLHPDGEITVSYSDDMGAHWVTGNGGQALEQVPLATSKQLGHVEDKQWVAVNHYPGNRFQDHVYATWDVIDGNVGSTVKLREATSRDRGKTFSPATTIVSASTDQLRDQYSQPAVDPNGDLYVAFTNIGTKSSTGDLFVTRSTDDGQTFSTPVLAGTSHLMGTPRLPNTTFRDGINFAFAVSPDFPGHLYLAYNDFNGTQYNVYLVQSTDGGQTWSKAKAVNDDIGSGRVADHFQPAVAAGPGGAVAVAFYDRRAACPNDPSILRGTLPDGTVYTDMGKTNFCINVGVQPFKDVGTMAGAVAVGANIRASTFAWDPQQPGLAVTSSGTTDLQTLGGLGQMACASHNDPCRTSFIGDYFGLAISGGNIYTLSVSTHYSSGVTSDQGTPLYYQQQVLGTISRSSIASGF
ncbi:MAG TPA: sialidase family protein [Candidatus Dormibacteraeota bacterium]|nr:sialidase family protein [Candidatus Dormibacteraeota bacterium]